MTFPEFQKHMDRLVEQHGKSTYSDARIQLIWGSVKEFSSMWWGHTVDYLLGHFKQAPLMPEIGEAAGRERERLWALEKRRNAEQASDFWNGTFHPEEARQICETIKGRIQGRVGDAEYNEFLKMLGKIKHIQGGAA